MERQYESKMIGRRLLPNYIDAVATENPTKEAMTQIISYGPPPVYFNLTYQRLSSLINSLAWWLHDTVLQTTDKDVNIAYVGPSDIRHMLLALAAVKVGSRLLLLSPRNSAPIHEHLIKETKSLAIMFDSGFSSTVTALNLPGVTTVQAPDLIDLLTSDTPTKEYDYADTYDCAPHKPLVVFHTSGSTGMPKPVTFVHGAMAATDNIRQLYSKETYRVTRLQALSSAASAFNGFPLFHLGGFVAGFFWLLGGANIVVGPPNQLPSPEMLKSTMKMTQVDGAFLPPLVVDQVAQDPALVEAVTKLRFISTGGGSVSQAAGDLLSQKTQLHNILGSSECGLIGTFMLEPENWTWFHFAEKEMGIHWHPIDDNARQESGETQYYEMVLHRDDNLPQRQGVFQNFPHLDEWHTKDIYCRHPTIPYYWKYESRIDDVIVFSTGEKMNPVSLERQLNLLSGVQASLVLGQRRPYPVLLIELAESASREEILPAIHQALEELNKQSMKYAQIRRNDILIAGPEKPFARMDKGTISRSQTTKLYAAEIEALYESPKHTPDPEIQSTLDPSTYGALAHSIAKMVGKLTVVQEMGIHDDFFANGLDSRQVQILAGSLAQALQKDVFFLRNAVYMNPTAHRLVEYIRGHHSFDDVSDTFNEIFERYSAALPQQMRPLQVVRGDKHHVLLTGSTGFVGSFVLRSLMQRHHVSKITCIDRRLVEIPTVQTTATVHQFKGDLSQPYLGLPKENYARLLSTVTEIIHCQWPVTFAMPLTLFEPHIAGVANLIRLAYSSRQDARIIFLSSIATIQGWDHAAPVPEAPLHSLEYAQGGYGQSKLLASKLLEKAGLTSGVSSAICRVGQVAGPIQSKGVWPPRDWFPTLLRASEIMGCLPGSLGSFNNIDWLPVDSLSEQLADLAVGDGTTEAPELTAYYHFSNPSVSAYSDLVPTIVHRLGRDCKVVPSLTEWDETLAGWPLKENAKRGSDAEATMAATMALREFYQGLAASPNQHSVRLDTSLTAARIPSLQAVGAVNKAWMDLWLDQWGFEGEAYLGYIAKHQHE